MRIVGLRDRGLSEQPACGDSVLVQAVEQFGLDRQLPGASTMMRARYEDGAAMAVGDLSIINLPLGLAGRAAFAAMLLLG